MPIFRVKSVKIYTVQKKFTRIYSCRSWQISGMGVGLTKVTIRYVQLAKYIFSTSSVCRWRKEKFASLSNSCESDPISGSLLSSSAGTGKTREKFGLRVFPKSWTPKSHSTAVRRHCTDWYEIWALTDHEIYYIEIELDLRKFSNCPFSETEKGFGVIPTPGGSQCTGVSPTLSWK